MIKVSVINIIKNFLILIPFIKKRARKRHRTGILNNKELVEARVNELLSIIKSNFIINASVIEVGPGQTGDTIINLNKTKFVQTAYALDIVKYYSDKYWIKNGVKIFP